MAITSDSVRQAAAGFAHTSRAPEGERANAAVIVIPARLASTRLPRKLLLRETGRTLIEHTFLAANQSQFAREVYVATDDREIFHEVQAFGGRPIMTSVDLQSGTDRVAQAAREIPDAEIIVNVQGDEPELEGAAIDLLIQLLRDHPQVPMATLATPIRSREIWEDPACVKVVFDARGLALYFSRSPIPRARDVPGGFPALEPPVSHLHLGIYAYRKNFLTQLAQLPPSRLEQVEKLEQLRVLEAGHSILVGVVPRAAVGIDTPADYQAFVERCRAR